MEKKKKKKRRVGRSLIIANKSIKETEILIFFRVRSNFISLMNTKTCILVSIRWNKIRSHTEKKNKKHPVSVITVFQYFKYINNKLKDRNIVIRGNVTISKVEQNDTCTSI